MGLILRLVALFAVLGVAVPLLGGATPFGSIVRAALEDAAGFCDRRPETCAESASLVRDAGALLSDTLAGLGERSAPAGTLTAEDRTLAPARDALAGGGSKPAP
jgi:hypothetical protein